MSDIELSIIVPVYNTQEYLEKCIASLVTQDVAAFEVLIINDGSTDDSALLADKIQKQHPKIIKLLNKENGGLSDARNYGLNHAQGEFVAFVDSDDVVDDHMFSKLLSKAKGTMAEIVFCDFDVVNVEGKRVMLWSAGDCPSEGVNLRDTPELLAKILPSACNKIYKRTLFKAPSSLFDKGIWYEDAAFIPFLMASCHRVAKVSEPLYKYVKREGSISASYSNKVLDGLKSTAFLEARFSQNQLTKKFYSPLLSMQLNMLAFTAIRIFKAPSIKLLISDINVVKSALSRVEGNWQQSKEFKALSRFPRWVLLAMKYNVTLSMWFIYKVKTSIKSSGL